MIHYTGAEKDSLMVSSPVCLAFEIEVAQMASDVLKLVVNNIPKEYGKPKTYHEHVIADYNAQYRRQLEDA